MEAFVVVCQPRSPPRPCKGGGELTQAAHETFDSHVTAETSRQHLVQACFVLREQQGNEHRDCVTLHSGYVNEPGMRLGSEHIALPFRAQTLWSE